MHERERETSFNLKKVQYHKTKYIDVLQLRFTDFVCIPEVSLFMQVSPVSNGNSADSIHSSSPKKEVVQRSDFWLNNINYSFVFARMQFLSQMQVVDYGFLYDELLLSFSIHNFFTDIPHFSICKHSPTTCIWFFS